MQKMPVAMVAGFACSATLAATASNVHFLARDEARAALTGADERAFYSHMQLLEMRARTGLALQDVSLAAARDQVSAAFGAAAEDFTDEEKAALRDATGHLQPLLEAQAPLYARTPWSFIKVTPNVEGGLPHTRGDSIVLSEPVLASIVRAHGKGNLDTPSPVRALLIHEQTHVIQRRHPALFAPLYTSVMGFQHVDLPSPPRWISALSITDPDAPVPEWAFSLGQGAGQRWLLPVVFVDHGDHPKMPGDFRVVAVRIVHQGRSWDYADHSQPADTPELDSLSAYVERFPVRDELFHPNEIAADMLSYLLIGAALPDPENALWSGTQVWVRKALR